MAKITQEEFQKILKMLEEAGMEPQVCNTPVLYIDTAVQAGIPTNRGEFTRGKTLMLPEELIKGNLTFVVDIGVLTEDDYDSFAYKVSSLLPMHDRLPVPSELRRMAVDSFRKQVDDWRSEDAPVSGYRFEAYRRIARQTREKLLR